MSGSALEQQTGKLTVAITGASGLIGSALGEALQSRQHTVLRMVRGEPKDPHSEIRWNAAAGRIDAQRLEGIDALVHLAGENIAGRWTAAKKQAIRESRVEGTRFLCESLAQLEAPPKVLVAASAIGYYGDRGEEELSESSPPGESFLAEVCRQWEEATLPARGAGVRVVNLRIGVVLSPKGGALSQMLLPFKLGLGGVVGSGRQYMSWIALDELVGVIQHALATSELSGPVNATTPRPVTNRQFTKTLGKVLGRPTIFPMPAFAARLAFGQMADELLLASARVLPAKLQSTEYSFELPELEPALRHVLK